MTESTPVGQSTYETLGPYYCSLKFAKYSRPKPFDTSKFESTKTIILPLPSELMDTTSVDYSTTELETVGDILNGNVSSGLAAFGLRQAGGQLSEMGGAGLAAASQMLGADQSLADRISNSAQKVLDPDRITSAIQAEMGIAPNPNQTVVFKGPKLREFSFSWTFYPDSPTESANIKRAIAEIRKRSLPFSVRGTSSGVLGYPEMVLINFYPWDNDTAINNNPYGWTENSIIRIKRCVVDRVAVNYAPNNVPAFFQGTTMPVAIRLEISLRELEYMMAEDYMEGGIEGTEARDARLSRAGAFIAAGAMGGAVIGGGAAGWPGGISGAVLGGVLTGGAFTGDAVSALGDYANDQLSNFESLFFGSGQPQQPPATPGGTTVQAQPQATPPQVNEALAQPNGGQ